MTMVFENDKECTKFGLVLKTYLSVRKTFGK